VASELAEQIEYYGAIANEYEDHAIDSDGGDELYHAVVNFAAQGDVLELGCGFGAWTELLIASATTLTAVDAAPEMLARAEQRLGGRGVEFIQADVFNWEPSQTYDAVFFGFLLSHIPLERFNEFWSLIDRCLRPDGRVLFVDDNHRSSSEERFGADSEVVERRLNDGTAFNIIKIRHQPAVLRERLALTGWDIDVTPAGRHFYWGHGSKPAK